jgi:hypothetical protein
MSAIDVLARQLAALTDEVESIAAASPVEIATVTASNPAAGTVDLSFTGGGTLPAVPAVASYAPVVGHTVLVTLNGSQPVVAGVAGSPPGASVTVGGVTVTGAVGALLVEWTASTAPTMSGSRGMYQVQLDTAQTFDSQTGSLPLEDRQVMATSILIGTGLDPSTIYYVRVRAIDTYGTAGPWTFPATGSPISVSGPTVIAPGSITTPMLAAGAVTADKIAANTITSGQIAAGTITANDLAALTLTLGQFIQSANYVPTISGWRVNADGSAEFNNVIVRGLVSSVVVSASQITTTEGVNLLPNPSFETDLSNWTFGVTTVRDNAQAKLGSWSARMTAGVTGVAPPVDLEAAVSTQLDVESAAVTHIDTEGTPGSSVALSVRIACTPGITYEARAWWYYGGTTATIQVQCGVQFYDASGAAIGTTVLGKPFFPYHGLWVSTSSGGAVAPANAAYLAEVAQFNGFSSGDTMWLDRCNLYATSTFIGQFATSSVPDLPLVQIVDNDPTYGPSMTISDGRNAFANLGLVSPAGKPTTTLQGAAYDSNVPKLTMIGGDGLAGPSSVGVVADQLGFHGVTPVALEPAANSLKVALANLGLVTPGNPGRASLWRAMAGGALANPNGAVLWAADRVPCQVSFTKVRADTALEISLTLTHYVSAGTAEAAWGITPDGGTTLWQILKFFFNNVNVHATLTGRRVITGVAAGTYTLEPYAGLGTPLQYNMDANDFLTYTVEEV